MDVVTGLFNRGYLNRRLEHDFDDARRTERPFSLALIDVDHFGQVNKDHGWPSGDRVLNEISRRVSVNVRSEDWVARYGGEELCVVLVDSRLEAAIAVLERVRAAIEAQPFQTAQGVPLPVTVSVGVAERRPAESLELLRQRVSDQLQAAKKSGRNRVVG